MTEPLDAPFLGCSHCDAALRDHQYVDLAVVTLGSPEEQHLLSILEGERWEDLPHPPDPSASETGVVFRIVRCPADTGIAVCLRLAQDAADDDVTIGTLYHLGALDLAEIESAISCRWRPYSATWLHRGKQEAGEQGHAADERRMSR
jgi:hypothetical protein